jgi:nucleotide-binding universal stress UspA family protein
MYSRLVVGIDGSPGADAALAATLTLAGRFGATIVAAAITDVAFLEATTLAGGGLMAEAPTQPADTSRLGAVIEERCVELLKVAAARAADAGLAAETVHATGFVDEELLRIAAADTLVVGRRGEAHGRAGALGSVTTRMVRRAEVTLVVAGEAPSRFVRPLVVADSLETGSAALEAARSLMGGAAATPELVHAGDDPRTIVARAVEYDADVLVAGLPAGNDRRSRAGRGHFVRLLRATAIPLIMTA